MAYRRYKRSRKYSYRRKRSYRRGRRARLSRKKLKTWYPDLAFQTLLFKEKGFVENSEGTNYCMANARSPFGPGDGTTGGEAHRFYHKFYMVPDLKSGTSTGIGEIIDQKTVGVPTVDVISEQFPDLKTACLRYLGYRIMGMYVQMTIRCADNQPLPNVATVTAFPYFVTGVPWQEDEPSKGNHWDGESQVTQNGVTASLQYNMVGRLRQGTARNVKGFGAKNGSQKTVSYYFYPWKVYGMTKQQWLNSDKSFLVCDAVNNNKWRPYFVLSMADYNLDVQREYNFDYKIYYKVRWEGQKFLLPSQA